MTEFTIRPVGFVRSNIQHIPFLDGESTDPSVKWQERVRQAKRDRGSISELVIEESLNGILDGIQDYSHLLVIFWAHRIPDEKRKIIKGHPMGREDFPIVGIFSTRSPVRPNPILVTVVRLLERKGNILKVAGLEAVDGSPVLDIKPYISDRNDADEVKMPDWMSDIQRALNE
jgi:tRNA (adenine37-N6)-methyltransferase